MPNTISKRHGNVRGGAVNIYKIFITGRTTFRNSVGNQWLIIFTKFGMPNFLPETLITSTYEQVDSSLSKNQVLIS